MAETPPYDSPVDLEATQITPKNKKTKVIVADNQESLADLIDDMFRCPQKYGLRRKKSPLQSDFWLYD